MRYTSAEANKLLKRLQEEKSNLVCKEEISRVFVAATIEDVEQARPDYNYEEVQAGLVELDRKIRTVKHAINVFNTTHVVDGFDMTIDQLLREGWNRGVAWQDGRPFHGSSSIRINLASPYSRIEEAFRRLDQFLII